MKVGEPVGLMYGFVTDGFYQIDEFDYNAGDCHLYPKAGYRMLMVVYGAPQPGIIKMERPEWRWY